VTVPDEILPPELLDGLDDLEWAARMVARGLGPGIHTSPFVGQGEEFERHRPYQQGDDLRHLDWRLLARTDRLHVRRFREASNVHTVFVVDASASMDFAGTGGDVTKLRYAVLLAAALGYVARSGGDVLGLVIPGGTRGTPATILPPRPGRERWKAFLHALQATGPGRLDTTSPESGPVQGGLPGSLAVALEESAGLLPRGGRLVVLSDFLDGQDVDGVLRTPGELRARGDDGVAIRILTPEGLGEAGGEHALWTDPEHPERSLPGTPGRDPGYRARLDAYYDAVSGPLEALGVSWYEARSTDPPLPLVRRWIREGSGRRRR